MKKNIVSILTYAALGLSTLMVSCGGESNSGEANKVTNVASEIAFVRVDISGMTCAVGCAKTIEKMLSETDGVESAEVNFEKEAAFINYDKAKVSETDLIAAIAKFKDGSYSAKLSDKNCKSECKKTCCAKKDDKKATGKTVKDVKEVESKRVGKEIEKAGKDLKSSVRNTRHTLDEKATEAIVKGHNAVNKTTESVKTVKDNAEKDLSAIKKSAKEMNAKVGDEVRSLDASAKKVMKK